MILVLNLKENFNLAQMKRYEKSIRKYKVIVLPQYPYFHLFNKGKYILGSQDVSKYECGAHTGEVSINTLKDYNVKYVLVNHFEKNETEETIVEKLKVINKHNLIPIYCIGESEEEYKNNNVVNVLLKQINLIPYTNKEIIIAYEPIWKIGRKNESTNIVYLIEIINNLVNTLKQKFTNYKLIIGGGVNITNIISLKNINGIDGFIISTSALDIDELNNIIKMI